jgi:hypothetical protein
LPAVPGRIQVMLDGIPVAAAAGDEGMVNLMSVGEPERFQLSLNDLTIAVAREAQATLPIEPSRSASRKRLPIARTCMCLAGAVLGDVGDPEPRHTSSRSWIRLRRGVWSGSIQWGGVQWGVPLIMWPVQPRLGCSRW